ncbi:hypothetical protein V6N11_002248 [Hibiscus sabdariffa]|uniref:BHLH domain-containing protein n=1 Tax=Hibiscus sabdariffa TaxID=183260 RepID=A0ABR2QV22_9ROSI
MEFSEDGFLEELLAPKGESWTTFSSGETEFLPSVSWDFDSFDGNPTLGLPTSNLSHSLVGFPFPPPPHELHCPLSLTHQSYPFFDVEAPFGLQHHSSLHVEDQQPQSLCKGKVEMDMGDMLGKKKSKSNKLQGQPSKNLMAERRRRKRLNDRLSMLRSIVPKISKVTLLSPLFLINFIIFCNSCNNNGEHNQMDRTSILGDTIDYMKELLERINKLQEEETSQPILLSNLKEEKPNQVLFDVERRGDTDTRIDICCATKPGLVFSTVSTLEALGLEIQQCVISCFNDFSMQASCSEVAEQRTMISSEDIKQSLFRNAGYCGRCQQNQ